MTTNTRAAIAAMTMMKKRTENLTGISPLSEEKVREWQLERIKETVARARENSRFYQKHLKSCKSFDGWQDFNDLPFTFPDDLKDNPYDFLCVSPNEVSRIVTIQTSGTSGIKKRVFFTEADMERTVDFFHHGMGFMTEKGDKVAIFMPGQTMGSVGDLLSKGLVRLGAEPITCGIPESAEKAAQVILENSINVAVALPMDIYRVAISKFAPQIKEKGTLKNVLLSADNVTQVMSDIISESLGCKVFEHYGMTETVFGGAVFCQSLDGYHLRDADMYFEVVDIKTGKPCKLGEYGEIAVTTFASEAMPLIRYRTGDIGRFKAEKCACGYSLPVLERVFCTLNDVISLPDGSIITRPEIEDSVMLCCRPENISVLWDEESKTVRIGTFKPQDECIFGEEIAERLRLAGANIEFFDMERQETDFRAMTKRGVLRK